MIISASNKEIKLNRKDSPKNWKINFVLVAPTTFLTPTSFALFIDRAVDKLIKLMQAINNIKNAMLERV